VPPGYCTLITDVRIAFFVEAQAPFASYVGEPSVRMLAILHIQLSHNFREAILRRRLFGATPSSFYYVGGIGHALIPMKIAQAIGRDLSIARKWPIVAGRWRRLASARITSQAAAAAPRGILKLFGTVE